MEHGLEFKYSKEGNALKRLKESKWIAPQEDIQSHQIYVHVGYSVYILYFTWTSVVCVTAYKSQEF